MRANQKILKLASAITCWIIVIAGQKTSLDTPENLQGFHNLKNWLRRTFGMLRKFYILSVLMYINRSLSKSDRSKR